MSYLIIVILIIIAEIVAHILYRIEERLYSKYMRNIACGKKLDELVYKKYSIKRKGFGPWFFFFKEGDRSLRARAIKEHVRRLYRARIGDPNFDILPKWL